MGRIKFTLSAVCAAMVLTVAVAAAQGTLADRKTVVTFSGPVSVPGTTLPAGTYVFKIADSPANRHIVQIFDKDDVKLITTLLAVAAERNEAEGDPVVSFKETPADRPPAVRYWYYAGEKAGNEFLYPKAQAMMIAQASGETVKAIDTDSTDIEAWKTGTVTTVSPTASSTTSSASTASTTTASPASTTTASTTTEPTTSASTTSTASTTTAPTTTASTTTAPTTSASTTSTASTTSAPTTSASTTSTVSTTSAPTTSTTTAPTVSTTAPTTTAPVTEPPPPPVTTAPVTEPPPPATVTAPVTAEPTPVGTSGRAETLPHTASNVPLVGLIGLLAVAGALGVRAARRARV